MVDSKKYTFTQAEKSASVLFAIALILLITSPKYFFLPLLFFICLCCVAPFCPQWGFFLPIIKESITENKGIALTFDDGPSPDSTPIILNLLDKHNYKATFFVIGQKASKYPELINKIITNGHTIGNHSWSHDYLLMLKSNENLRKDIAKTQRVLKNLGVKPKIFRPPAGITNPRLKHILSKEHLLAVTFNCRAYDYGNKKITNLAIRILRNIKPGSIILLHDLSPNNESQKRLWEDELHILFSKLKEKNYDIQPLSNLIGTRVSEFELYN